MTKESKVAVVTGATRGMGFETCRQLLKHGYRVILTGRSLDAAREAAARLAEFGDVEAFELDVTRPESARRLADHVRDRHGRLDALINNAGAFFEPTDQAALHSTSVFDMSPDTLAKTLETNAFGAMHVMQALVPIMREAGRGCVVNVSSGMGSIQTMERGWPAYRLSKAMLNVLTRLFADETRGTAIKINAVCPGWVRTDMGGPTAALSVEEGVDTTVWLATLPDDGPTNGFFRNRRPAEW